jgi:hypothetical protein
MPAEKSSRLKAVWNHGKAELAVGAMLIVLCFGTYALLRAIITPGAPQPSKPCDSFSSSACSAKASNADPSSGTYGETSSPITDPPTRSPSATLDPSVPATRTPTPSVPASQSPTGCHTAPPTSSPTPSTSPTPTSSPTASTSATPTSSPTASTSATPTSSPTATQCFSLTVATFFPPGPGPTMHQDDARRSIGPK